MLLHGLRIHGTRRSTKLLATYTKSVMQVASGGYLMRAPMIGVASTGNGLFLATPLKQVFPIVPRRGRQVHLDVQLTWFEKTPATLCREQGA